MENKQERISSLEETTHQMEMAEHKEKQKLMKMWLKIGWSIVIVVLLFMGIIPKYTVWQKGLAGKSKLKEAEWSRQIVIEEAKAKKESAKSLADAEIERARGVAEANNIIGNSLKDNEAYLRYLYIQGLQDKDNNIIYVPTEAGLPILEAGKR